MTPPLPINRSDPQEPSHLYDSLELGDSSWCGPAHFQHPLTPQIRALLNDLIGQTLRPSPASLCSSWRSEA